MLSDGAGLGGAFPAHVHRTVRTAISHAGLVVIDQSLVRDYGNNTEVCNGSAPTEQVYGLRCWLVEVGKWR